MQDGIYLLRGSRERELGGALSAGMPSKTSSPGGGGIRLAPSSPQGAGFSPDTNKWSGSP